MTHILGLTGTGHLDHVAINGAEQVWDTPRRSGAPVVTTAAELDAMMRRFAGTNALVLPDARHLTGLDNLGNHGWILQTGRTGWTVAVSESRRWYIGVQVTAGTDPLINPAVGTLDAVANLAGWYTLIGTHYRHTPGAAATAALYATLAGSCKPHEMKLRSWGALAQWWEPPAPITDIVWAQPGRPPLAAHQWDMRAAYLAAAAAVDLPRQRPQETGTFAYDHVGYYRVTIDAEATRYGPLLGQADRKGTRWICHPVARQLHDWKMPFQVHDAITAPSAGRILRGFADTWRTAITEPDLHPTLARALKRGYAEAVGLLSVQAGAIYRPDWRHMIIDQVRASLLRRIHTVGIETGLLPYRINVDSIWYPDNSGGQVDNLIGTGPKIGNMRYEGITNPCPKSSSTR